MKTKARQNKNKQNVFEIIVVSASLLKKVKKNNMLQFYVTYLNADIFIFYTS